MNSKSKGNIGEIKVASEFILAGEDAIKAYACYLKDNELHQLPDAPGKDTKKFHKKI